MMAQLRKSNLKKKKENPIWFFKNFTLEFISAHEIIETGKPGRQWYATKHAYYCN